MKAKITFKVFAFLFCLNIFAPVIQAQEAPKWIIFYSFESEERNNPEIVKKRLAEFLARLAQEPKTTRGFIDVPGNTKIAQEMKMFIAANSKLKKRIVFSWNTTVPERPISSFDFIIVPQGAPIPYPIVHEPVECPYIEVTGTTKKVGRNFFITFVARPKIENISYPELKGLINPVFKWKISAGEIVKGQGTAKLKVAAKNAKEVTAAVGLGSDRYSECESDFSETVVIQQ